MFLFYFLFYSYVCSKIFLSIVWQNWSARCSLLMNNFFRCEASDLAKYYVANIKEFAKKNLRPKLYPGYKICCLENKQAQNLHYTALIFLFTLVLAATRTINNIFKLLSWIYYDKNAKIALMNLRIMIFGKYGSKIPMKLTKKIEAWNLKFSKKKKAWSQ